MLGFADIMAGKPISVVFAVIVLGLALNGTDSVGSRRKEAYVTLLYGDEFLLGVRVLGKSIRDTGSTKDMVVLVSDGVSKHAINLLKADGWIVDIISLLENPNHVRPKRFWGVYTKLKIFNMTDYEKVVYLDADTIVVKNIDDLFKCGKFCANLKHSERLNSGVMVVEPDEKVFNDMMKKVSTLPSYTGGDQGFLNSYYSDFPNAHVFQPNSPRDSKPPAMERLSTLYNADVGLYMLANKWMVDETELRVIHYTLGPLKPWDWWTSWLVKPVDVWQDMRERLEESLPGTGGGSNRSDEIAVKFLFALPLFSLLFFCYRYYPQNLQSLFRISMCDHGRQLYHKFRAVVGFGYTVPSSSAVSSPHKMYSSGFGKVSDYLGAVSVVICLLSTLVSLAMSFAIVPRQVTPWTGLLLMYEWTFTFFALLFGFYLHRICIWGKTIATHGGSISSLPDVSDYNYQKDHQKHGINCDVVWHYWFGIAALAVAAPSLPFIFGITALFARLGLIVSGCLVLISFMAYASQQLAIRYFLKGFLLEERDSKRIKNNFSC